MSPGSRCHVATTTLAARQRQRLWRQRAHERWPPLAPPPHCGDPQITSLPFRSDGPKTRAILQVRGVALSEGRRRHLTKWTWSHFAGGVVR